MGGEGSIVGKQHLPDQYAVKFCLGFQEGKIEQIAVFPCVGEDAIFRLMDSIVQDQGE